MLTFLNLPNEILTKVVEELDIRSIFILRRVCHHLRNLIDDSKLSLRETNIKISVYCEIIDLSISLGQDSITIGYQTHQNGCMLIDKSLKPPPSLEISKNDKTKLSEGADYFEEFIKDLDGILKILSWKVDSFCLSLEYTHPLVDQLLSPVFNRFLELFYKKGTLHMNYASIWILTPDELLRILPWIEPRKVELWNVRPFSKTKIQSTEFVELGYWKQIETFNSGPFVLTGVDFREFSHFKDAIVAVEDVNCEDIMILKEAFLRSTNFEQFKIKYENFADILKLSEILGKPVTPGEWVFPIPESRGLSLKIFMDRPNHHSLNFVTC